MTFSSIYLNDNSDYLDMLCVLSINSFLKNGHRFELYTYKDFKNIPVGCIVKDAREIIHESDIFKHEATGSYAAFSDVFRWKLLYEKGGFYVDTDVACISDKVPEDDVYLIGAWADVNDVCPGCVKLPAKSVFAKTLSEIYYYPCNRTKYDNEYTLKVKNEILESHSNSKMLLKYFPWAWVGYNFIHSVTVDLDMMKYVHHDDEHLKVMSNETLVFNDDAFKLKSMYSKSAWSIHLFGGSRSNVLNENSRHGIIKELCDLYL